MRKHTKQRARCSWCAHMSEKIDLLEEQVKDARRAMEDARQAANVVTRSRTRLVNLIIAATESEAGLYKNWGL